MDHGSFMFGALFGTIATAVFSTIVEPGTRGNWREAVSRGYAEYCPKDDNFAWKGECK